ncbi:MAG: hypothetical protein CGU28_14370 [Candidatus Dactylopiibacterium carminicum]|uniref:4Fe-4S ferredoxin-type domain-containing protein n=1 Tax=Candidatus Dactylopiibacterium carminicum TaxID=857335 RepID=A0A272ENR4_9RHOO|nr:hypothetical protein [Candidatus Dactylopiibacterium carminicum]KAF7598120.1 hypothetical protein BGI27_15005 [Candidatus Dactylopiibacterium carminicum]PAS91743.1 MAG: hypothetical protein CGU29_14735 [Candidatus Dactylopiibacterium carminicum]PAS94012.1 MAG: hypothetical protein CGU28_14370 [Candidatus Dactylopiibacterium carminicum]PAS96680.1 MAG: hypothetical protein BSR46_15045 [Candidatus Dactylopiibacterium carminicum]
MNRLPASQFLDDAGLNRQHVFDLAALPADLLAPLQPRAHECRLILFGHAGRRLWECVQAEGLRREHPIDEYSVRTVESWLANALPAAQARFVFPAALGTVQVGLQRLGALAGWHHAAPFMVGVDAKWGSWFAYRAVILIDTALPVSEPEDLGHPCSGCKEKTCITACTAGALTEGVFNGPRCRAGRLAETSPCALGCLARMACPVGTEHRYEESQIRHSAAGSLAVLRRYAGLV